MHGSWGGGAGFKLRSHAYGLACGYGIRIRQLGKVFTCTRLHAHGFIGTACPQFYYLSHLTRTCSMAPVSAKLCNYMLQQDDILVKIICLYRQIKKKKKANNMRSMRRWWIHPILLKREEQGTYHRLVQELQLDAEKFQSYFRLSREQFAQVLFLVEEPLIRESSSRESKCPRQRLTIF